MTGGGFVAWVLRLAPAGREALYDADGRLLIAYASTAAAALAEVRSRAADALGDEVS